MIRQYGGQRCQGGHNPLRVGVIPVGAIFYVQDDGWWRDRYRGAPICRNPWIVEAFLNGTIGAARCNRDTGLWEDVYFAGRSDMALVRSLRDGRRWQVAVRTLILHEEHGLTMGATSYPTLPDMSLYRINRRPLLQETPWQESLPCHRNRPAGRAVDGCRLVASMST